ncbi:MAG: hypothetical protein AB7L76_10660 [Burkholderiaceae bacterium]
MASTHSVIAPPNTLPPRAEAGRSAVSWGAVFAGAAIAAALSAMLITGGSGLGFLAISPWRNEGASGSAIAVGTIVWLLIVQIIAYGVAGFVAGRLRTRWTDAAHDEIYFRDTAHGFLVWAVSVLVGLVLLGSTAASLVSGAAHTGATLVGSGAGAATALAGQAASGDADNARLDYFTDALLRADDPSRTQPGDSRGEVSRILGNALLQGDLDDADRSYLIRLIANRTGVDEATAQQRVADITARARQAAQQAEQTAREAADTARKAAATFSLWAFASMLIGAFVASYAATIGGRARDE